MTTLAKDVYRVLRHRVRTRELPPGKPVLERALAKELGVSRTPVHDAIGRLVSEGVLKRVPNVGAFVKIPNPAELRQDYELRAWVEGEAAAKAATCIGGAGLVGLERQCDQMQKAIDRQRERGSELWPQEDVERFAAADLSFHIALVKASGNERALRFLTNQHLLSEIWGAETYPMMPRSESGEKDDHRLIVEALRRGDAEAARRTVREHIMKGMEILLAGLEGLDAKHERTYVSAGRRAALEEQLRMIEDRESPPPLD